MRGIAGSETVSSAQLKGVEIVVADIGDFKTGTDNDSEMVIIGNGGSVWVDMVAEEGMGMIRGFVWMEVVVVVTGSVWIVTFTLDARADSQRSCSSRIPAKYPSAKALSLDSCMRSEKSLRASERRSSYCASSSSTHLPYPSLKAQSHRALRFSLPEDEVAEVRNELIVSRSASLMNVWNASS